MKFYTWLLFDVDGTLLDFQQAESVALNTTPSQMGVVMPAEYVSTYHQINDSLWRDFEAGALSAQDVRTKRFHLLFKELEIAGDAQAFSEGFLKNLIAASGFFEGTEQVLRKLEGQFRLALLTNGFADVQHARIARLGLGKLFDPIIISEEVSVAKPASAVFDIALEGMGGPDKGSVLMIGDSLSSDIQGGANAGIDTCWLNPTSNANNTDVVPTYEIQNLSELPSLLARRIEPVTDEIRDSLRQAYDAGALTRDRSDLPKWKRAERANFLSHLRARRVRTLLEVGSGTGKDGRYFSDAGCEVTCIDLSPTMVQLCREKGLKAMEMDIAHLTFSDASFDAIYSFNSLLHLPKAELPAVLIELQRVLMPGGLFYLGTYGGFDHEGIYEDDDHSPRRFFSFYEDAQLRRLTSEVFDELSFQSLKFPGNEGPLRFQSLLLQRPVEV